MVRSFVITAMSAAALCAVDGGSGSTDRGHGR